MRLWCQYKTFERLMHFVKQYHWMVKMFKSIFWIQLAKKNMPLSVTTISDLAKDFYVFFPLSNQALVKTPLKLQKLTLRNPFKNPILNQDMAFTVEKGHWLPHKRITGGYYWTSRTNNESERRIAKCSDHPGLK